jgi:hypothetical protein
MTREERAAALSAITVSWDRRAAIRRIAEHEMAIARERLGQAILALRELEAHDEADRFTRMRDELGQIVKKEAG